MQRWWVCVGENPKQKGKGLETWHSQSVKKGSCYCKMPRQNSRSMHFNVKGCFASSIVTQECVQAVTHLHVLAGCSVPSDGYYLGSQLLDYSIERLEWYSSIRWMLRSSHMLPLGHGELYVEIRKLKASGTNSYPTRAPITESWWRFVYHCILSKIIFRTSLYKY